MESEKVKEIKDYLEQSACMYGNMQKQTLILINELESENERLSKEKENLRLFDIALGNGKVDMTLGGDTAKTFINTIVQIFEQNNATNFLATTIEAVSSGNKYSLVIQKENGQTPSEKLTELKDRIAELEKENATKTDTITDLLKKQEFYEKEKLTKFAERLKEKLFDLGNIVNENDIDETLKVFIK